MTSHDGRCAPDRKATAASDLAVGRSPVRQRRDVWQLLRLRLHRAPRRHPSNSARIQLLPDWNAQRDLQLSQHRDGPDRRRDRRSDRNADRHPRVHRHLRGGRHPDGDLPVFRDDGARAPRLRAGRRVDDCGGDCGTRTVVRRKTAWLRVRAEPEHRPRRILRGRPFAAVGRKRVRLRLARADADRRWLRSRGPRRCRRLLDPGARRGAALRDRPAGAAGSDRHGPISGASTVRTGTSSVSA